MKLTFVLSGLAVIAALAAGCSQNSDQSNTATPTNQAPSYDTRSAATNMSDTNADNTRMNERDRDTTNLTAMDQGNSPADIQTSAAIRKMVTSSTNNFSTTAQNIKIITQNGKVTLR